MTLVSISFLFSLTSQHLILVRYRFSSSSNQICTCKMCIFIRKVNEVMIDKKNRIRFWNVKNVFVRLYNISYCKLGFCSTSRYNVCKSQLLYRDDMISSFKILNVCLLLKTIQSAWLVLEFHCCQICSFQHQDNFSGKPLGSFQAPFHYCTTSIDLFTCLAPDSNLKSGLIYAICFAILVLTWLVSWNKLLVTVFCAMKQNVTQMLFAHNQSPE